MAVPQVCVDYDSYVKIGPNQKKKGLRLSGSSSTIRPHNNNNFQDFSFWDSTILEEGERWPLQHC